MQGFVIVSIIFLCSWMRLIIYAVKILYNLAIAFVIMELYFMLMMFFVLFD